MRTVQIQTKLTDVLCEANLAVAVVFVKDGKHCGLGGKHSHAKQDGDAGDGGEGGSRCHLRVVLKRLEVPVFL